jgi:hypothetical protein
MAVPERELALPDSSECSSVSVSCAESLSSISRSRDSGCKKKLRTFFAQPLSKLQVREVRVSDAAGDARAAVGARTG